MITFHRRIYLLFITWISILCSNLAYEPDYVVSIREKSTIIKPNGKKSVVWKHICAGAVIRPQEILVSAHCLIPDGPLNLKNLKVSRFSAFFQTFFKAIFLKFAKILNQVYAKGGSSWPVAIDIDSAKINPNWNIGGIKIGGDFALLKLVNWKNHSWLKWLLLFNLEVGKFTLVCMKISKITYAHIFFKNYSNNL